MEIAKALDIITAKVDASLLKNGYQRHEVADTDNEKTVLYTGDAAYSIVYYTDKKRIVLRTCSMEEGEPDNAWKTVATWLYDEEVDTAKEAENIGNDFVETINGPKQLAAVAQKKRSKKENGEQTNDPLFFANRMIAYFPELRDEVAYEKAHYESFRGITFAEEKILPRFLEYVNTQGDKNLEKLSKSLSDLYEAGDLDVKGIITYILLNGIGNKTEEQKAQFEKMIGSFTRDQQKVARASRNLIGKRMKPEKPKKPKRLMTETLNAMNERQNQTKR